MIQPLNDRIVVAPFEREQKTAGGLIINSEKKEHTQFAKVVAVGPGTEDNPVVVNVGDTVIISKSVGTEVKIDGMDYVIVKQKDVLGVIE